MKKAVLISALLFSFLISYSSHLTGSEITAKCSGNTEVFYFNTNSVENSQLSINSELPGDTVAYLYLDPVSNTLYLSITLDKSAKVTIIVLDILGTAVWSLPETTYDSGKQLISGILNLDNGQYIVKVLKNGIVYKTQKILVIK